MTVLALASFPQASSGQIPLSAPSAAPQILVSASGEIRTKPDRATVMFTVETRGQSATGAAGENAKRQKAVTDVLQTKIGSQDQVTTTGYSVLVDEKYEGGQRKLVGYIARNTVLLETRLIDKVGSFIDAALSNGSNVISGVRFWSSTLDVAHREALAAAVTRARADAEAIARAAGGSLGPVLEIQSTSLGPIVAEAMVMRSAGPETPIIPSDQTITASIIARWAFIAGRS